METIRQKIVVDAEVKNQIYSYNAQVDQIFNAHTAVEKAKTALARFDLNGVQSAKDEMALIEGEIAFEIANNAELKNENQRKAALKQELAKHEGYKTAQAKAKQLAQSRIEVESEIAKAKIEYERQCNRFAGLLRFAEVVAGLSREEVQHRILNETTINVTGGNRV